MLAWLLEIKQKNYDENKNYKENILNWTKNKFICNKINLKCGIYLQVINSFHDLTNAVREKSYWVKTNISVIRCLSKS